MDCKTTNSFFLVRGMLLLTQREQRCNCWMPSVILVMILLMGFVPLQAQYDGGIGRGDIAGSYVDTNAGG
jgi:hypothetical protein